MLIFGIVSYQDRHYLEHSLPAVLELLHWLRAEGHSACAVLQDNASDPELQTFLEKKFPDVLYQTVPEGNVGYGSGYNAILKAHPEAEILFAVTSDVVLDIEGAKWAIDYFFKEKKLMMLAGKLALIPRQVGAEMKGKLSAHLDSAGIWAQRRHHFSEWGSGQVDSEAIDARLGEVFGISGAAFLLRTEVIPRLMGSRWELFDPAFWMYKEDIDLAYRLREGGEDLEVVPWMWGGHLRGAANREGVGAKALLKSDAQKAAWVRRHSYRNHLRLLKNHPPLRLGLGIFLRVLCYEILKAGYLFFRDPRALIFGVWGLLFIPARRSPKRVPSSQLRRFFH